MSPLALGESMGVTGLYYDDSGASTTGVATAGDRGVPKAGVEGVAAVRGVASGVVDPLSISWTPSSMV